MKVSAYIPCFNNESTITTAVKSVLNQSYPVDELIVIDDGSSDRSYEKMQNLPISIHRIEENKGRGYVRNFAMKACKHDLVLCCDATNSLDSNFLKIAIKHLNKDHNISSVSGIIKARSVNGTISRWRSRHLFKEGISYPPGHITNTSLVTYGTLVRKSTLLNAGNFDPTLKHSEDEDLGQRLKKLGFKSLGDPKLITYSEIENSLVQVLERHWRWHIGKKECLTLKSYLNLIRGSLNPMMVQDIKAADPVASLISLVYPHFFLFKTLFAGNSKRNVCF